MDQLTTALAPIFVAGFAVQQFLEILTAVLNIDSNASFEKYKKAILGVASLVLGLVLAGCICKFRILTALNIGPYPKLDVLISGLVLSAGTEGVNSILKFFKYSKEDKKATAAAKTDGGGGLAANVAAGVPTAEALKRMNRK